MAILGVVAAAVHLHGIGLVSLATLPLMAAVIDIVFQSLRFSTLRPPDAAIATGMLLALLGGNLAAVAVSHFRGGAPNPRASRRVPSRSGGRRRRERLDRDTSREAPRDWGAGHRVAAASLVFVLVTVMVFASQGPSSTPAAVFRPGVPSRPPAGGFVSDCTTDNPSVPPDVLTVLHNRLGASVVLSYDASAGTVVFYDPVNRATITETDLYEDYGYAEFNGDDYVVMGCSP